MNPIMQNKLTHLDSFYNDARDVLYEGYAG